MDRKTFYEVQKFKSFLAEKIGPQEVRDIHLHAMEGVARGEAYVGVGDYGCSGFVYYRDTAEVYEKFADAIWGAAYYAAIEAGSGHVKRDKRGDVIAVNPLAYLAEQGTPARGGSGAWLVSSAHGFENMAVWWMADRVIQGIATEEFLKAVSGLDEPTWFHVAHLLYPDAGDWDGFKARTTFLNTREEDDVFDREWSDRFLHPVLARERADYS